MTVITLRTEIAAPPETVFDLSIDVDVHTASAAHTSERAIRGVVGGKMRLGDTVTWKARHLGKMWRMTAKITQYDRPHSFSVIQVRGPFRHMNDRHAFVAVSGGTVLQRSFEYSTPMGPLGRFADWLLIRRHLREFLEQRDAYIKRVAERSAAD